MHRCADRRRICGPAPHTRAPAHPPQRPARPHAQPGAVPAQILSHDITFGIGPAGTGKTFLAVACAVDALERSGVQRIVLTRPAVEAGERLGFLPGDLAQKVDPYLRPLYDALYDLMGFDRVQAAFEKGLLEIAPLAFMRGRTLNHAFVILDEAQNTTPEQMKMFLTRIGFGSKAWSRATSARSTCPRAAPAGWSTPSGRAARCAGIAFTQFTSADVVRHPLVARIVEAYDAARGAGKAMIRRAALQLSLQFADPTLRALLPRHSVQRWMCAALDAPAEITVRIVGDAEGRQLNRDFRGKDYATNVLTFDYQHAPVVVADLVLSAGVLQREAADLGLPVADHAAHLLVHGALHAQGFDHENDEEAAVMEARETAILRGLGLHDPYAP
jgi:rRNA maturation RNase YbeY